jgi:hypothetical protein
LSDVNLSVGSKKESGTMRIYLHVSAADAIKAGKTQHGWIPVNVSDDQLAILTQEARDVLAANARVGANATGYERELTWQGAQPNGGVATATFETLVACIHEEQAQQAKREEEEKQRLVRFQDERDEERAEVMAEPLEELIRSNGATYEPRNCARALTDEPDYWGRKPRPATAEHKERYAQIVAECERRSAERRECDMRKEQEADERQKALAAEKKRNVQAYEEAKVAWLAEKGTESMRQRAAEGYLAYDELERAIRDDIFAPMASHPRFEKLQAGDITHGEVCSGDGTIQVRAGDAESLTAEEYADLLQVRTLANTFGGKVKARCHSVRCTACGEGTMCIGFLVKVDWHGTTFSREYAPMCE